MNVADSMLRCSEFWIVKLGLPITIIQLSKIRTIEPTLSSHAVYCTRSNQGKNLGALLCRNSQKILAFRRAGPPHSTHHCGRSYVFERFLDKQRLRGRTVDIFWSKRLRELVFPHAVGKCRHYHHRRLGRLSMPRLCRTPF